MHVHLFRFLERFRDPDIATAVDLLEKLKEQRVGADYLLQEEVSMLAVQEAIEQAEYLLNELLPPPEPA